MAPGPDCQAPKPSKCRSSPKSGERRRNQRFSGSPIEAAHEDPSSHAPQWRISAVACRARAVSAGRPGFARTTGTPRLGALRRAKLRAPACYGLRSRPRGLKRRARAVSSVGRALRLHRRCRRFEPVTAHQPRAFDSSVDAIVPFMRRVRPTERACARRGQADRSHIPGRSRRRSYAAPL